MILRPPRSTRPCTPLHYSTALGTLTLRLRYDHGTRTVLSHYLCNAHGTITVRLRYDHSTLVQRLRYDHSTLTYDDATLMVRSRYAYGRSCNADVTSMVRSRYDHSAYLYVTVPCLHRDRCCGHSSSYRWSDLDRKVSGNLQPCGHSRKWHIKQTVVAVRLVCDWITA
jgi:hypothetical protein